MPSKRNARILHDQNSQNVSSVFSFFIYFLFRAFKEQFADAADGRWEHILHLFSYCGIFLAQCSAKQLLGIFRKVGAKYSGYRS